MFPAGYHVVTQTAKGLIIGMDFAHMSKECVPEITLDGKVYEAGPMTTIPPQHSSTYCSCREYFFVDKRVVGPDELVFLENNSIRHITNQFDFELLATELGVRENWQEPDEQGLTLEFNGKVFGCDGIWGHKMAIAPDSLEQYVTIRKDDKPIAEVNMATLMSWASNHELKPQMVEKPVKPAEPDLGELVDHFSTEGFNSFLYDLICNPDTDEKVHIHPLDSGTAAVCAFVGGLPHGNWTIAQYFEEESVIKVTIADCTYEYACMTFDEALKEAHKLLWARAENMRSLDDLYTLLSQHTNVDAEALFKDVLRNNHHSSVNFYDVLKDMDQDPDDILSDAVDETISDTTDSTLIEVATRHFDLGSDELMEAALDNGPNMAGSDVVDLANDMEVELPKSIIAALYND